MAKNKAANVETAADSESSIPNLAMLPDGRIVPGIRTELGPDAHTPGHLLSWIKMVEGKGGWPSHHLEFKRKLCNDSRMTGFWEWIGTVHFNRHDMMRSSTSVSKQIYRSTRLPGKPGNMTPTQREGYFKKIRSHVGALLELLEGTMFDQPFMTELTDNELDRTLHESLDSWGDDESDDGHVVAYQVTPEGRYRHHYDFPDNVLCETLRNVYEWTRWDDNWDGGMSTSAPIAQSNSESTPIIYFCCTLHDWFHRYGVAIPFGVLATVANVALDLPADRQIDEDNARKQVRRFQQRRAKMQDSRPPTF